MTLTELFTGHTGNLAGCMYIRRCRGLCITSWYMSPGGKTHTITGVYTERISPWV